ncbi:MAG: hypothetical protein WCS28_11270 [Thiomicrospira sp.]
MASLLNNLRDLRNYHPAKLKLAALLIAIALSVWIALLSGLDVLSTMDKTRSVKQELQNKSQDLINLNQQLSNLKVELSNLKKTAGVSDGESKEMIFDVKPYVSHFALLKATTGIDITPIKQRQSQYENAVAVEFKIATQAPGEIGFALDFLQFFGYVEAYKNDVATVHVALLSN